MAPRILHEFRCQNFRDTRKIIVIEEKRRKYIGKNSSEKLFASFRVDGCLIKDGRKCDYLLINVNEMIAYFIELKGQDLVKALEQINTTIDNLAEELAGYQINARIVLTKVNTPDILDSRYLRLQRRMRNYNGTLEKGVNVYQESV